MGNFKQIAKFIAMSMAAYAVVDYVQTNVAKVPVVGKYLPGGGDK